MHKIKFKTNYKLQEIVIELILSPKSKFNTPKKMMNNILFLDIALEIKRKYK